MYVNVHLKLPEAGEWVALTRVNAAGETEAWGYVEVEMLNSSDLDEHLNRMLGSWNPETRQFER